MMRPVTTQAEIEALAVACGMPPVTDTGEPHIERMNAVGWGDPLRGVFLAEPVGETTVEVHAIVLPQARGREAITAGREFLDVLGRLGLRAIGIIPKDRPHAFAFSRLTGMQMAGETHEHWYSVGGA
jgi:hypothetical protein